MRPRWPAEASSTPEGLEKTSKQEQEQPMFNQTERERERSGEMFNQSHPQLSSPAVRPPSLPYLETPWDM